MFTSPLTPSSPLPLPPSAHPAIQPATVYPPLSELVGPGGKCGIPGREILNARQDSNGLHLHELLAILFALAQAYAASLERGMPEHGHLIMISVLVAVASNSTRSYLVEAQPADRCAKAEA